MDETLAMDRTAPPTPDAPEYPQYWEADVVASDGGVVHLRPILPSDADAIVEFHSRLSERTRLLEHLAAAGRERGVRRFEAEVLAGNAQMVRVFRNAGFQVSREFAEGVLHLEFDIDPGPTA